MMLHRLALRINKKFFSFIKHLPDSKFWLFCQFKLLKFKRVKQNTLCVLPFIHFNILSNGQASLCCVSMDPLPDKNGMPLNVRTHSLQEIWGSQTMRDVRTKMLLGEKPSQCQVCYKYEKATGFSSNRNQQNSLMLSSKGKVPLGDGWKRFIKLKASPKNTWKNFPQISRDSLKPNMRKPWYLDLRFDNVCNLKCVICFGYASSRIESDPVHIAWTGENQIQRNPNRFGTEQWVRSNILFEELIDIGSDVYYIQLAGGEPFLSELAVKWLKHLGETGRAKFVTLKVFTNFNIFNEDIIKLLEPFHFVDLTLSIDAVGPVYEYVRYPGKWKRIARHAELLAMEMKEGRLKRMSVNVNTTMSAMGGAAIVEVFEFAKKHGFNATLNNASYPEYAATKYLPTRTKARLEKKLKRFADDNPQYIHMKGQIDQWLFELQSIDIREPQYREAVSNLMRFVNDMDASRGLNFRSIMPEVYDDYIAEFGEWLNERRFASLKKTGSDDSLDLATY